MIDKLSKGRLLNGGRPFFWEFQYFFIEYFVCKKNYPIFASILQNQNMADEKETYAPFRYISPTTDFGFKKLLGDKRIMKGFLNALFESKKLTFRIEDLVYIDKESSGTTDKNRASYLI